MSDKKDSTDNSRPSATHSGKGVPRREVPEEEEEDVPEEEKGGQKGELEYLVDKTTGKIQWVNEATFENQMIKFPGTYKFGPMKYVSFNMGDEMDVENLNKLLEGTVPMEAPGIKVLSHDKKFSEKRGVWMVMLCYQTVFYKVILQDKV